MTGHDSWLRLTQSQTAYLLRCAEKPQSSDVGAATVSSLRKLGYIRAEKSNGVTVNTITDAGRTALQLAMTGHGSGLV